MDIVALCLAAAVKKWFMISIIVRIVSEMDLLNIQLLIVIMNYVVKVINIMCNSLKKYLKIKKF